jgi:two-component system OmpR family response regulator
MTAALLLTDDPSLTRLIQRSLFNEGVHITHCATLNQAVAVFKTELPTITLIDAGLHNGLALEFVCYARRHFPTTGIILMGEATQADKIAGLEMGADEYLVAPLEMRELALRVQRLAKRVSAVRVAPDVEIQEFFGFTVNILQRTLRHKSYGWLSLTGMEFDLLLHLLHSNHQTITRDELCRALHGRVTLHDNRTIDTLVSALRIKLKQACLSNLIEPVRGKGYIFCAPFTPPLQPNRS